jgi:acylphosphatase
MQARVHCVALGLVQGVGYRWFVARRAQSLGLSGFVRNLYDGTVELEAEGERSLIEELIKESRVGPRSAQVTKLIIEWVEPLNQLGGFNIR